MERQRLKVESEILPVMQLSRLAAIIALTKDQDFFSSSRFLPHTLYQLQQIL